MDKANEWSKVRVGHVVDGLNAGGGPPIAAEDFFRVFLQDELATAFRAGVVEGHAQANKRELVSEG